MARVYSTKEIGSSPCPKPRDADTPTAHLETGKSLLPAQCAINEGTSRFRVAKGDEVIEGLGLVMPAETSKVPPPLGQMIFGDGTPKRAFLTALVVGTILTTINHGDMILMGQWPPLVKVGLTYCVPYFVTTWGAVSGKRAQWRRAATRS